MKSHTFVKKLALAGLLVAMQIVLSRYLGIQAPFFQANLGFTAVATAGAVLGPVWGACVAAVADFLGTTIAGTGAYFPLFGVNEVLCALIFAFYFYNKKPTAFRGVMSVVTNTAFVSIPLTPLWLSIYYPLFAPEKAAPYFEIFTVKITASLIELPIKIAVMIPLCMLVFPRLKKMMRV